MSLSGNLSTLPLNSILQLISDEEKTGVLKVSNGPQEVKIYFKDGYVVYATGFQEEPRLDSLLLKDNVVSKAQLSDCLATAKAQAKYLGQVLVERGYISEDILREYIQRQTAEVIYSALLWQAGEFEYRNARLQLNGLVTARLNVIQLLLESSRRIDEMAFLMSSNAQP